jgi:hypothetical protein
LYALSQCSGSSGRCSPGSDIIINCIQNSMLEHNHFKIDNNQKRSIHNRTPNK